MPKFAANLSMLYTELPFLDRFEAAARDGFQGVEFLFPYAWPEAEIAARLRHHGLRQVLFNAPPGGADPAAMAAAWDGGDRGTACIAGREGEFRAGVLQALRTAEALDCPRIHLMAGLLADSGHRQRAWRTYADNLRWAAEQARQAGREVLVEPINHHDMPGYFLTLQAQAHALLDELQSPEGLKVQMDLYHCQRMEGDALAQLRRHLPTGRIAHLQVAGVPGRHEPSVGSLDFAALFDAADELGYGGWVGCEYRPQRGAVAGGTTAGLGWMARWR